MSSSFQNLKLSKQLLNAVLDQGFTTPTAIQEKAIPLALAGHDVMGIAQTGTGKSAAFILPILQKLKYAQGMHARALILAPTRELVDQIAQHAEALCAYNDLRSCALYGGVGPKEQIKAIEEGVDLLVSTPGRFMDLYKREVLYVRDLKTLVLDEADKMMDMGFMPQIRSILEVIPVKRQNLLFSATMPAKVIKLAEEFLEYPQIVEVTPSATAAETVAQVAYEVPNFKTKINLLELLLQDQDAFQKVIVFVRTKKVADNIFKFLTRKVTGEVKVIHSNKGQNTRLNNIEGFKEGSVRILVSTDVSARGIDVSMVSHVINFEVPVVYEDYVHRIGRTGRARHSGYAITFYNSAEVYHLKNIEKIIKSEIPKKELPAQLRIETTDFEEQQQMARQIDQQKRKSDPNYQGAFHDKKKKGSGKGKKRSSKRFKNN